MHVRNEELRTTRELAREVNPILDSLSSGELAKVVVTDRSGKMRAVMVTPEEYDNLRSKQIDVD